MVRGATSGTRLAARSRGSFRSLIVVRTGEVGAGTSRSRSTSIGGTGTVIFNPRVLLSQ